MSFHPSQKRRELDKAWELFVSGDTRELDKVRHTIRDSWIRSRSYDVNPDLPSAPYSLSQEDLSNLKHRSDLLDAGDRVAHRMFDVMEDAQLLVALLDEHGQVLSLRISPLIEDKCLEINATAGSAWGEKHVGTDAGTALITGQPTHIRPGEHYCYAWREWRTNAIPIRDPFMQQIIGALTVDWPGERVHPHIFKLLRWGKDTIEQNLHERRLFDRLYLLERYCQHESRFPSEAILAIDRAGYIMAVSPHAASILRQPPSRLMYHPVSLALGKEIEEVREKEEERDLLLPGTNFSSVRIRVLPINRQRKTIGRIIALQRRPAPPATRADGQPIHRVSARGRISSHFWQAIHTFDGLIGRNVYFQQARQQAEAMAVTDLPILLVGESGTGKELFAHAIHNASPRSSGPFVPVNCGSVPEDLIGAELFGYVEGAFTGAARGGRQGKIEIAHSGTLFLDEITAMPPKMQVSLLRVSEDGVVVPVGSTQPRSIDVRVIAAVSKDPTGAINQGILRADLYYRLSGALITLPPLRERKEDIPLLAQHILLQAGLDVAITPEVMEILKAYPWPGNIRELKNVLLQVANLATERRIRPSDLPSKVLGVTGNGEAWELRPLARAEKVLITRTIEESGGHLSLAASRLGIHRTTLYRKMRQYGVARS